MPFLLEPSSPPSLPSLPSRYLAKLLHVDNFQQHAILPHIMTQITIHVLVLVCFLIASLISAQTAGEDAYIGYKLNQRGDPESAVFATNTTTPNVSTTNPDPDVFLNASVHVGVIDLTVTNLTAQINLQASVLSLLQFNAGVSVSIDEV
jgi:hypothetical protein